MTIDPPSNWSHADALDRGELPQSPPKIDMDAHQNACRSLRTLLQKGDSAHSEQFYDGLAKRLVANALLVRGYLKPCVADERVVLRQQQPARYTDEDDILERLAYLKTETDLLYGYLHAMGSVYARDFDPDSRGERDDDRRISQERADEQAAAGMPRTA